MGTVNKDRKSLLRNSRKLRTCNFAEYRFSFIPLNSPVSCFGKVSTPDTRRPNIRQHPGSFRSQGLVAELWPGRMQRNNCQRKNEKEFLACL